MPFRLGINNILYFLNSVKRDSAKKLRNDGARKFFKEKNVKDETFSQKTIVFL